MESKTEKRTAKRLLWPASSLVISFAALGMVILAGQASASPLSTNGSGVPLPPPTVPATLPPASSTPIHHGTPGTPGATQVPTHITTTTPGVPHPLPTSQATVVTCNIPFTDVHPTDWFYEPVGWMYCHGIVSGYSDNTFRPNNATSRGQMAKIAMGAFPLTPNTDGSPHFADVAPDNTFYTSIETSFHYGIIQGYPCGGDGEPCDSQDRPYFRPGSLVTRGQLAKITVRTAMIANPSVWQLLDPLTASFVDVPVGSTFFPYVETAVAHTILQGYACGGAGEPCPGRYFRTGRSATRAQLSKIVYQAVTQP